MTPGTPPPTPTATGPVKSARQALADEAAQAAVDAAVAAFAASAGVPAAEVRVVTVEPVTWPDSSLGCPQPGQSYLQVITPGYRVVLEAGEERATYHTSDGNAGQIVVIRCDGGGLGQLNLDAFSAPALDNARRDLAERLGGQPAIDLVANVIAPVTRLVCPGTPVASGPNVPALVVFEFQLRAEGEIHLYRAAGERILYCGPYRPPPVDAQGNPTE
jgi:hypothetical protein